MLHRSSPILPLAMPMSASLFCLTILAWLAVTIPREQALDSEIFCGITEKGVEMAKKMQSGTQVADGPSFAAFSTCQATHESLVADFVLLGGIMAKLCDSV